MRRRFASNLFACLILLGGAGCAPPKNRSARLPAVLSSAQYTVTTEGKLLVVTPPAPAHPAWPRLVPWKKRGPECAVRTALLAVDGSSHRVDSYPEAWRGEDDRPSVVLMQAIAETRAALIGLEGNGATDLLRSIPETVPLPSSVAFELRYGPSWHTGAIDLEAPLELKIVRPIERDGQIRGFRNSFFALVNLLPQGFRLHGQATADSDTERGMLETANTADPIADQLNRVPYQRMLYLTRASQVDNDLAVLGAPTRAGLERAHRDFLGNPSAPCAAVAANSVCILVPRAVALRVETGVTVNGKPVRIPSGGAVKHALEAAGVALAPGKLTILRPYAQASIRVAFDPKSADILRLVMLGGESISVAP